jgi:hypothetical protein
MIFKTPIEIREKIEADAGMVEVFSLDLSGSRHAVEYEDHRMHRLRASVRDVQGNQFYIDEINPGLDAFDTPIMVIEPDGLLRQVVKIDMTMAYKAWGASEISFWVFSDNDKHDPSFMECTAFQTDVELELDSLKNMHVCFEFNDTIEMQTETVPVFRHPRRQSNKAACVHLLMVRLTKDGLQRVTAEWNSAPILADVGWMGPSLKSVQICGPKMASYPDFVGRPVVPGVGWFGSLTLGPGGAAFDNAAPVYPDEYRPLTW